MRAKGTERRRYGRIHLDTVLSGRLDDQRVKVLELSVSGFLVAIETRISPGGPPRTLHVEWQESEIELQCEIVRATLWRMARSAGERSIYHVGLRIVDVSRKSFEMLRELIGERILRALDEQKANARGLPPLVSYFYQPEKGDLYRRCELIDGVWRKTETLRHDQPPHGFTISAEVHPDHVEMLCRTWEATTEEGRRLTRLLAELSVSKAEGIATRRYEP